MNPPWHAPLLWLVITISLVVAGVGAARLVGENADADLGTVPVASVPLAAVPARAAHPGAAQPAAPSAGAEPVRLSMPALGLMDAPIVPVGLLPAGDLDVPDDPTVLGWWRHGARPASPRGTVVIDGHVDTRKSGEGAFFKLGRARPGTSITLDTTAGRVEYVVRAVRRYEKAALPADVFDTSGLARLVLISCGGSWDPATHQYSENVVVYATPVVT